MWPVQVSVLVCFVAATYTCKQCCPSLPPAPPAIETADDKSESNRRVLLPPTAITTHYYHRAHPFSAGKLLQKLQLSDILNFKIWIFPISPFHYFPPPSRQSGWATSGSSPNKAGVVQYFHMNNSKAFHNCWCQIKFPSRKGRNANFLISDSVGL